MKRFLLSLIIGFLYACASPSHPKTISTEKNPGRSLTVIATSDFHGALESELSINPEGKVIAMGGASVLASYLKILQEQSPGPWIWVDAGDLFQGTMASNRFEGAPVIRFYNHMKLSAAALGNHEFDFGPVGPKAVPRTPQDDPRGALKKRAREASFPFLSANVREEDGRSPEWVKPSVVVDAGGLRIGIVGASTPDTPATTNALNLKGLTFTDPLPAVRAEGEKLRAQGVDALLLVMHIGGNCENNALGAQDDLSSCSETEALDLVKKLPEGLFDVAVAGHSHRGVAKRIGQTVVMQAFSHGKYIAWASVPLGDRSAKPVVEGLEPVCLSTLKSGNRQSCEPSFVKKSRGAVEPAFFLGQQIVTDTEVTTLLKPELDKVAALKDKKLGSVAADSFSRIYGAESALGNLIADLTREVAKTDLGVANGGGLRADLSEGPITYGRLFNVIPFDNQLAVLKVPGATVYDLVHLGMFRGRGGLTWSKNLRATAKDCDLTRVSVGGRPLDKKRIYSIATSDFLAGGGDGVASLHIPSSQIEVYWDSNFILRDMIAKGLSTKKRVLRTSDFYRPGDLRLQMNGRCANVPAPSGGN